MAGYAEAIDLFGEPAGTRTQGPRLKRAMLYRLSYRLTEWERLALISGRVTLFTGSNVRSQRLVAVVAVRFGSSGFRRMIVS